MRECAWLEILLVMDWPTLWQAEMNCLKCLFTDSEMISACSGVSKPEVVGGEAG